MKKILFAVKNMNVGGVEKSLLSLLNTLDRTEYEVDLLLLEESGGFLNAIPDWVNVVVCKDYASIKDEVNLPPVRVIMDHLHNGRIGRAVKLLVAYARTKVSRDYTYYYKAVFSTVGRLSKHYDVAVSYTSIISYLTWFVDFHVDADEYIGWIHFDVSQIEPDRKMLLDLHEKMKKIYVVSQSALDAFTAMFPELKEKSELRYNVVDKNRVLALAEEPVETIRQPGVKSIVTLGRLTSEKGQDIVPAVAKKLKQAGLPFRWYLIGEGGLRKQIEEKTKELGVENEVVLLGTKINPYPYLKQADLYVQTSVHEGFCITLAEAKAFDLPIVSTDCAGAHEQLDGQKHCAVVKRSTTELTNAILNIYKKWDES
ncbi:MAG: glycosyltransferase [Lachnospiraceae bacterium]|nr:glycosyltransferase [Lachnospiraceae bacterium]